MKVILALFAVCLASAYAANYQNAVVRLIQHEVTAIMKADPNLTVDHCTTKCDALFDLVDGHDESITDRACKAACNCHIHPASCHVNHHTTHAHHHTRPMPTTAAPIA